MQNGKKLAYGFDVRAVRGEYTPQRPLPVTPQQLAAVGIPARKLPRVQEELARLADADPALRSRATLLKLARQIAAQLL